MFRFVFSTALLALFLSGACAHAAILIPRQLTSNDREEALRIIGLATSSKVLSDPYPLGGYAGFEMGVSVENLPTDDLGRLGARLDKPQQDVSFPKFSIGKGLYNNLDFFLQFTPYNGHDQLSQYGGIARWGFYQAQFLPVNVSFLLHINNGNIGNSVTTRSYGFDFIAGINVDNVALFAGGGMTEATGTFSNQVTSTGSFETSLVSCFHSVVGANVRVFEKGFFALQIDRYTIPVFSGKLGIRF